METYKYKPIEIEAVQWQGAKTEGEAAKFLTDNGLIDDKGVFSFDKDTQILIIKDYLAYKGYWIIKQKGVKRVFKTVSDGEFRTYFDVEEQRKNKYILTSVAEAAPQHVP
jgi:ribosomal protein S8